MPPTLPGSPENSNAELASVTAFLEEQTLMSVATLRPDGWPQATSVGFLAQWPDIYFVVARESQKFQNMVHDPRISMCIVAATASAGGLSGVSMAALAEEVTDMPHIVRFDDAMLKRFPRGPMYNPIADAMALIRAKVQVISLVRISGARSHAQLMRVEEGRLVPA
ncbi:MAG TPA: pyridoxamine 5'-phosphate oxidase family protein [Caulobacteraceae bacterium]|jgi:uncharacterized pyridoxamine 5'-phosphate oxidase family protein